MPKCHFLEKRQGYNKYIEKWRFEIGNGIKVRTYVYNYVLKLHSKKSHSVFIYP